MPARPQSIEEFEKTNANRVCVVSEREMAGQIPHQEPGTPTKNDAIGRLRYAAQRVSSLEVPHWINNEKKSLSTKLDSLADELEQLIAHLMCGERVHVATIPVNGIEVDIGSLQIRMRDSHRANKPSSAIPSHHVELLVDGRQMDDLNWTSLHLHVDCRELVRCDVEFLPKVSVPEKLPQISGNSSSTH